jgi:preprotein translocase subunit SecY
LASSAAAAQHLDLRQRQVLGHRQVREQLEVLEHHAHAAAQLGQVGLGVVQLMPSTTMSPFWKGSSALMVLISVDLPEPEGPQTTTTSPF